MLSVPQEKGEGCRCHGPNKSFAPEAQWQWWEDGHGDSASFSAGVHLGLLPPHLSGSPGSAPRSSELGTWHWPRQSCAHLAELLLVLLAVVSHVSQPQVTFLFDAAAAGREWFIALGSLHVPAKARFTNLSLRLCSISKQPVVCFCQWPGCVSWAIGKQSPSAAPWARAVTHESSKDIANPPEAQGSSLGPSSWSSWRHLLFPTWSCLVWVWGWPVALGFGAWLLLALCNILFYSQFKSLHN